jgi:hypothetical protein
LFLNDLKGQPTFLLKDKFPSQWNNSLRII